MIQMEVSTLNQMLRDKYRKGMLKGMEVIEHNVALACQMGTPIDIGGKAYFIKSDIENLRDIFEGIEAESEGGRRV